MPDPQTAARRAKDWTAQLAGALIWWIIPVLAGVSSGSFGLPLAQSGFVWAGVFAWMGTGCALNAWRCGRVHCFFSGPALWIGAFGALLVGLRVLSGAHDLRDVVYGTVALVVVSYLPEAFWGKYVRSGR